MTGETKVQKSCEYCSLKSVPKFYGSKKKCLRP